MTKEDLQKHLYFFEKSYDSYWKFNKEFRVAKNKENRKRPKYDMECEQILVENYINNEKFDLRVLITGEKDDDYGRQIIFEDMFKLHLLESFPEIIKKIKDKLKELD